MREATFAVVVATYGSETWAELARDRAVPSAAAEAPDELIVLHDPGVQSSLARVRNRGGRRARSSHLVFLDADDELAPGYLAAFREAHAVLAAKPTEGSTRWRTRPSLLVPRVQEIAATGLERPPKFPNRQQPMEHLNHCVIGTAVPRLLFHSVGGFNNAYPIYEDWALFLACKRAGARLVDVAGAVYRAHEREGGGRNSFHADAKTAYETYWAIRDLDHSERAC